MFRTPPDSMYFFSAEEAVRYGINRKAGDPASPAMPASTMPATAAAAPASSSLDVLETLPAAPSAVAAAATTPALSERTSAALSTLETYTRQPTRIAIYTGLDFFGEDVGSDSVADAPSCAKRCFDLGGACKAFTYNVLTKAGRGPNCFLKSGRGEVDGNSAAFSGKLLARRTGSRLNDHQRHRSRSGPLPRCGCSRLRPFPTTAWCDGPNSTCRRACVTNDRCVAFTFLKPKKQCWLKGSVGTPRTLAGAVTGGRRRGRSPPDLINLD